MKKVYKILMLLSLFISIIIIFSNISYGKSYKIDDIDIQATILQNGDVEIKQTLVYNFNGEYNGIFIDIPYKLDASSYDTLREQSTIFKDSLYNNDSVTVNKISEVINGIEKNYEEVIVAYNGDTGKYTSSIDSGIMQLKIYSKSYNEIKNFNVNYTLKNTCIKHNDIGELYYNFIGGNWQCKIEKLNIDIFLPQNQSTENLKLFAHGPYNGVCKIISKNQVNLKVENIKPKQYVAARVLFDLDNINLSAKTSNNNAVDIVLKDENTIIEKQAEKDKFTNKIMIFSFILFGYWIILLLIYEKDKKYVAVDPKEEEIFKKYNPLLAGCIQGSREILARDIIAVILNLVNKNILEINSVPTKSKDIEYEHYLKAKPNVEIEMDEIEKYIYNWIFNGDTEIELNQRLKDLPKEKEANIKFKTLNKLTDEKLDKSGANKAKVPFALRFANTLIFIISILLVITHFQYNEFNMYAITENIGNNILIIFIITLVFLPLIMGVIYVLLNMVIFFRHKANKLIQKFTNQKVVTTTISILIIFIIAFCITLVLKIDRFIIADELLICISLIILLTDNLMLKNDVNMIEDFSRLNALKQKIEFSLMNTRNIEEIVLWENYLTYAISFGVADKITKKIKNLNIDDDVGKLLDNTLFINYLYSDYYDFYLYASLDRRFMRNYKTSMSTTTKAWVKVAGAIASSKGRRRRILWTAVDFRGGGRRPVAGGRSILIVLY